MIFQAPAGGQRDAQAAAARDPRGGRERPPLRQPLGQGRPGCKSYISYIYKLLSYIYIYIRPPPRDVAGENALLYGNHSDKAGQVVKVI